ncbi:hypothetical protein FA95DRAFT_1548149 [Auriscalpium vulgare]|uniref:Uncharacterized protein n=1 Tax=Auriscalpium vulgare TaxID=40419 RepID=A0ACB8RDE9_9AGAM|nr:hypothetical protein FA95DRAFT_1548149 [Auriscalpium vulgare]
MANFLDVPVELIPLILDHVLKASHLAAICLINHSFYVFAVSRLYSHVSIYPWYHNAKTRVMKLFATLAEYPHLAQLVRRLEIRDFPKALPSYEAYEQLRCSCFQGISNATRLQSCTWTRDGSLTSYILEPLQQCAQLRELEINGNHSGHYDPTTLTLFSRMTKISLIMPSGAVLDILPKWIEKTGDSIRSLTLICKSSLLVTDALLELVSPHLQRLEHLYLAGCPKVTDKGIWAMISHNVNGLVGLGIEGLSSSFDMGALSTHCARAGGLTSLTSFTLTIHPGHTTGSWMSSTTDLLSHSQLQIFQVYATTASFNNLLADRFCMSVITVHGHHLTRFSFHRLRVSLDAIEHVCRMCAHLEEIFVLVHADELAALGPILALASHLRAAHVNLTGQPTFYNPEADAMDIARRCSSTLVQLGINTRVWQVKRDIVFLAESGIATRPVLSAYENPDIPEQFLVVRA